MPKIYVYIFISMPMQFTPQEQNLSKNGISVQDNRHWLDSIAILK